jgi:hypothetical protein
VPPTVPLITIEEQEPEDKSVTRLLVPYGVLTKLQVLWVNQMILVVNTLTSKQPLDAWLGLRSLRLGTVLKQPDALVSLLKSIKR